MEKGAADLFEDKETDVERLENIGFHKIAEVAQSWVNRFIGFQGWVTPGKCPYWGMNPSCQGRFLRLEVCPCGDRDAAEMDSNWGVEGPVDGIVGQEALAKFLASPIEWKDSVMID